MDGFILYRVRENGSPAPPMHAWGNSKCTIWKSTWYFLSYGAQRNQSSFCFDEETEERRLRGSRRLKYSSSDKDHGKDYDDESKEEEEEGSERQPKGKLNG